MAKPDSAFFSPDVTQATDLDNAWLNFDPQLPLPDDTHPFYVHRPGEPVRLLAEALRRSADRSSDKFFFSGYRGSGKSTELNRLFNSAKLRERYWIARYSVRETADIQNLDAIDILLLLVAQIYEQYTAAGEELNDDILRELEGWKDRTVENLRDKGAVFESGAGFDLKAFFLAATLKLKTEHSTREQIREVIRPRVSELIEKIDIIAAAIHARQKKPLLVLVDDLDKLNLENARKLFCDNLNTLTEPNFAIVYTIPSALLYEDTFMDTPLQSSSKYLTNVRLHQKGSVVPDAEGVGFFRRFIQKRMNGALIEPDATDALIAMSGGVPSQLVLAVRAAIENASQRDAAQVTMADVPWALSQLRNPLLRLLSDGDIEVLKEIQRSHPDRFAEPQKQARLIHIQAALQYSNEDSDGVAWLDVNPVLAEVLKRA